MTCLPSWFRYKLWNWWTFSWLSRRVMIFFNMKNLMEGADLTRMRKLSRLGFQQLIAGIGVPVPLQSACRSVYLARWLNNMAQNYIYNIDKSKYKFLHSLTWAWTTLFNYNKVFSKPTQISARGIFLNYSLKGSPVTRSPVALNNQNKKS